MPQSKARKTQTLIDEKTIQQYHYWIIAVIAVITVINLVLGISILTKTASRHDVDRAIQSYEASTVGGQKNYEKFLQIIASDSFQEQQRFIMDQRYKIYFPEETSSNTTISGSSQ
jgi:hypothetical protein